MAVLQEAGRAEAFTYSNREAAVFYDEIELRDSAKNIAIEHD